MKNGRLFRIPLFGGLTQSLADTIPGVDFVLRQTDVRMPFEMRGDTLISDDVNIEGDLLSLKAAGRATLAGALDFRVQVKPLKGRTVAGAAARVLTYPVSKLFEFRLQGTVQKPQWAPASLPLEARPKPEPTAPDSPGRRSGAGES